MDDITFEVTSKITKQLDEIFQTGNLKGGLASNLKEMKPNTCYHIFVVTNIETVCSISENRIQGEITIDIGFDVDPDGSNIEKDFLKSGYTDFNRIGCILTDNDNKIIAFQH